MLIRCRRPLRPLSVTESRISGLLVPAYLRDGPEPGPLSRPLGQGALAGLHSIGLHERVSPPWGDRRALETRGTPGRSALPASRLAAPASLSAQGAPPRGAANGRADPGYGIPRNRRPSWSSCPRDANRAVSGRQIRGAYRLPAAANRELRSELGVPLDPAPGDLAWGRPLDSASRASCVLVAPRFAFFRGRRSRRRTRQ